MLRDELEGIVGTGSCVATCPEDRDCTKCVTDSILALMQKLVEGKRRERIFGVNDEEVDAHNSLVDDLLSELR